MPRNTPFQVVVDALLDKRTTFSARFLRYFSDISPEDLDAFVKAWPEISIRRKHALLEDLVDLAESDTLTCFDDLASALLNDPDPQVRVHAIRLLRENEDVKLVPILLRILSEDEEPMVRAAAADALGMFIYLGELEKIPAKLLREVEDALLKAVTLGNESLVSRRALEALGYSGREEVIQAIEAAYYEKSNNWVVSALIAMGRSSDDRWKKQVITKIRASEQEIRAHAIRAAGELELVSARPLLLDLLDDEEEVETRREIIWALSKIGGEGVRDRLEELLDAETDDEEAEFIEEAMDNLAFTEDMGPFDLIGLEPSESMHEEEFDFDDE